ERALGLVDRLRPADQSVTRMDLLEQRAFLRMSAWNLSGGVADLREVAQVAALAGAVDRQSKALLASVHGLIILDSRQALAAIDEGQAALSSAPDPVIGALIELCRQFSEIYLFGWSQERASAFEAALPAVASLTDPRLRSRIGMMEAGIACLSSRFSTASEKAEEARRASRKAGVFFEYFASTLFLHWAYIHLGNIGEALRIANEDGELALRNGSPIPRLWLTVRAGWSRMEAFDFEQPLAMYEQ